MQRIGIAATCNPGGASEPGKKPKWRKEYSEALRGADIIIIPDHDPAGYAHADAIASMSAGTAKSVRVLKLADHWPDCPKGGDISDWLAAGHTREQLDALIEREAKTESAQAGGDTAPPPTSEDSIALLFAERHGHELRYVAMWGRWLSYDGARWAYRRYPACLRPRARDLPGNSTDCDKPACGCVRENRRRRRAARQGRPPTGRHGRAMGRQWLDVQHRRMTTMASCDV